MFEMLIITSVPYHGHNSSWCKNILLNQERPENSTILAKTTKRVKWFNFIEPELNLTLNTPY